MEKKFVLKGNLCYSTEPTMLQIVEQGYLVCEDGKSLGIYPELPEEFAELPLEDYGDQLILPGLVDLHVHAPQYAFRGLGMDLELLDWLNTHTFPEEAKYRDLDYARKAYGIFAEQMKQSATTRACIFATIHKSATKILMDQMEESGLVTMIGKVNMDRNSPEYLVEASAEQSAADTVTWLEEMAGKYERVMPILTPRFIPSCSDDLMKRLKKIQLQYHLPVQSHLSENPGEISWVQELCPGAEFYGDAYDRFGLFGGDCKTVMAHCVYSGEEEQRRMKERGVFVAHCPQSNTNLSSGIAPIRRYLEEGISVGLGSDVAGGSSESIFRAMSDAIQVSKLYWRLIDQNEKPLTVEEAFFLATKGGGAFFGKVGSFEPGYELDVVVMDDSGIRHPQSLSVKERLERLIYLSQECHMKAKYVAGRKVL
ncbi:MAG: amidohydrolase family protein [Hungatella sp.]